LNYTVPSLRFSRCGSLLLSVLLGIVLVPAAGLGQKKRTQKKQTRQKTDQTKPIPKDELARLRDEYIKATEDYKGHLQRLRVTYESNVARAAKKFSDSHTLYQEGLISKHELDESELALNVARSKIVEVDQQMAGADTQIANTIVEADAEAKLAKAARSAKGSFIQTTSFIRYNGAGGWLLSDAWKVQQFFQDTFQRPLPIAVFGQGAIHDRWRLDHRNAMDISLNPDNPEAQALMNFMRNNGIPFSAFRSAIPGTATGPHIHIGRPSHRY
jgi:hypothetical protein